MIWKKSCFENRNTMHSHQRWKKCFFILKQFLRNNETKFCFGADGETFSRPLFSEWAYGSKFIGPCWPVKRNRYPRPSYFSASIFFRCWIFLNAVWILFHFFLGAAVNARFSMYYFISFSYKPCFFFTENTQLNLV